MSTNSRGFRAVTGRESSWAELIADWPDASPAIAVVGPEGLRSLSGQSELVTRWASVTKLVTAYGVLIGVSEEHWQLNDQAGPPGSTVRHLLAHASGLPFEGLAPIAMPGRRRIYSNAGFDLLGEFVAGRSGKSFDLYLKETVFEPIGIDAELTGRPSEGLVGAVTELARFAGELLMPTLLNFDLLSEATKVVFPGLAGTLPGVGRFNPLDWGLGFEIKDDKAPHWTGEANSAATFGHFGRSGAFLWVDPVARVALCVQSGRDFGPWALQAWPALADAVLRESGQLPDS